MLFNPINPDISTLAPATFGWWQVSHQGQINEQARVCFQLGFCFLDEEDMALDIGECSQPFCPTNREI